MAICKSFQVVQVVTPSCGVADYLSVWTWVEQRAVRFGRGLLTGKGGRVSLFLKLDSYLILSN